MGFFDNIKASVSERLHPQDKQQAYYDDGYDDGYGEPYDEGAYYDAQPPERDEPRSGMLGNPSRPEADSVSVYTRSGRHLSNDDLPREDSGAFGGTYAPDGAYRAADDSWRASAEAPREFAPARNEATGSYVPQMAQPGVFGSSDAPTPGDVGLTPSPRVTSGKLPAYVLKPTRYDDVQTVVARVRTNQPVVLAFKNLNIDIAKRILDFSFGLACGVDGTVEELGDRVFVVLPQGVELSSSELAKLRADGLVR